MTRLLETLGVTFAGGVLFTLLHVPLSWMLGPLTAVLLWQGTTKRLLAWPRALREAGLLLLGYSMGLSVTLESARQIGAQLPSMLIATLLTLGFSIAVAVWNSRGARISLQSGIIGSIPGGLSQMVVLSEEVAGADRTVVAFMQTIRLLTVIFTVPFLAVHGLAGGEASGAASLPPAALPALSGAGPFWHIPAAAVLTVGAALLAVKGRLPTPWFLGPIIAAALMTIGGFQPPHLPSVVIIAAQWSLGVYLGLGIKLSALSGWKRLLPFSLVGGFGVVLFSLALSVGMSALYPVSVATAFLSTSPGGMTEMGVTASLVHADVSMVVAYQMFRILFILFVVPYGLRWLFRRTDVASQR